MHGQWSLLDSYQRGVPRLPWQGREFRQVLRQQRVKVLDISQKEWEDYKGEDEDGDSLLGDASFEAEMSNQG